jgi:multidrug efflux pump subunit AcrB
MGWTIIGGLMVSTLLTLIIVPVTYKLIESKRS